MDRIRDLLSKPMGAAIAGAIAGLIVGLFFAWMVWPVNYTEAYPEDLRMEEKVEYMRMTVEAFAQTGNMERALARYMALGDDAEDALQTLETNPQGLSPEVVQAFRLVIGATAPTAGGQPGGEGAQATQPAAGVGATQPAAGAGGVEPEQEGTSLLQTLLTVLCVIVLLGIALAAVYFLMRNRGGMRMPTAPRAGAPMTPAQQAQQARQQATFTQYDQQDPPLVQFMASYRKGDDLFDDSFSIDNPTGEFLGECGVGISETIGVGDPKKVTAFEVWLFDKNDIQTVTKVLMSGHAFQDDNTRQRLEAKGEPVPVSPGAEAVLNTQTLQLVARVVDMEYGEGAMPPESYFERFILELAVWRVPGQV